MNEIIQCLKDRRSVRKYKKEQVKEEQLTQILEAGTYAPTGMGMQSPIMVVVQDAETIAKLSKLNAAVMGVTSDPFYGAPTVIVVLAEQSRGTCVEDGSLVMGNLMNAAYAVGVDSCWIHRAREVFASEEGKALLAQWGIEGDYIGIGHCILGQEASLALRARSIPICLTLLYIKKQRGEIISRPYLYTVCIKLLTARRIFSETPCIFMYLATVEPLLPISRPTAA